MKFSTNSIMLNLKTIMNVSSDFVYLDVAENKMYFASDLQALRLDVEFKEVTDEKIFVIKKADFIHIATFADTINLTSDYRYVAGEATGTFERNEAFASVLSSIKIMFVNSDSYKDMFVVDANILDKLSRASIFVNPEDTKISFRNLNIQSKKVFSSSEYRIYLNDIPEVSVDGIIHSDVLKFLMQMGIGTDVKNNSDSYLLTNNGVAMYFSTMKGVDFIPVLDDAFQQKYKQIYETNALAFSVKELQSKLNFISFYAKNNPSNIAFLSINADDTVTLSTGDNNSVSVEVDNIKYIEKCDEPFKLPFNALSMLNIISKLGKAVDTVTIYASKDSSFKLFVVSFSDTEKVIMSKINV